MCDVSLPARHSSSYTLTCWPLTADLGPRMLGDVATNKPCTCAAGHLHAA